MVKDLMRYDTMVAGALRGVMIEALGRAAASGLPGDHHFFIEFDTRHPGVRLPAELFAQNPETMTIVLQNQFWDLEVSGEQFTVALAFSGIHQSLTVPFDSVVGFTDPSVKFRLQFEVGEAVADAAGDDRLPAPDGETPTPSGETPAAAADARADARVDARADARADDGSAEVVTLDAFRKK